MIVTCMWGVSDPLRAARGAKKGAAKWGSLTPHSAPCSLRQRRGLRNRRHRTPPAYDLRLLTGKNIGLVCLAQGEGRRGLCERASVGQGGTVLQSFGSPTLFPSRAAHDSSQSGQNLVTLDL